MLKQSSSKKYGYRVEIHSECVDEERSEEAYGSWRESYSNSFVGIAPFPSSKNKGAPEAVSEHQIPPGQVAHVVWLEYSVGDSFGHGDRCRTEVVGVFADYCCAVELRKALLNFSTNPETKSWDDKYKFYYQTSDGQEFEHGYPPWLGYFEHLDDVHIESAEVQREIRR